MPLLLCKHEEKAKEKTECGSHFLVNILFLSGKNTTIYST